MHAQDKWFDHQHSILARPRERFCKPFRRDRETTDNSKQRALRKQPTHPLVPPGHF